MVREKRYLSPLLKNGHSQMTLELRPRRVSSLCFMQILFRSGIHDFMREARSRNIKGSALKSICFIRESVTYIHRSTFARHVGTSTSFHHWCKEKIKGNSIGDEQPQSSSSIPGQKRVDENIINNSKEYYRVLFRTILTLLKEELTFTKFAPFVKLQEESGIRVANDKLNTTTAEEMASILCDVITSTVIGYCDESRFTSLSGDGSEARKTVEAKELVFLKLLAKGFSGYVPVTFVLKCQRLKYFGGASAEGTFKAMLDALESYFPSDELVKKIVCVVADGASVNFGNISRALTRMVGLVSWDLPTIHCMNHRLELAMKDSYQGEKSFQKVKEMLDSLYCLFRNSGKTWSLFQLIASTLHIPSLRFTRVGGTRFQAHTLIALKNFLRNFFTTLLFAENVEEHGLGKNSLVTKETYAKVIKFCKK